MKLGPKDSTRLIDGVAFAREIKHTMNEKNLTTIELARMIGIHKDTIKNAIRYGRLGRRSLIKIRKAFIDIKYLEE